MYHLYLVDFDYTAAKKIFYFIQLLQDFSIDIVVIFSRKIIMWHCEVLFITTAQLHATGSELMSSLGLNLAGKLVTLK